MRHAARQLTDGLQLLRLEQLGLQLGLLLLRPLAGRDVGGNPHADQAAVDPLDRAYPDFIPAPLRHVLVLPLARQGRMTILFQQLRIGTHRLGIAQPLHLLPNSLLDAVAAHPAAIFVQEQQLMGRHVRDGDNGLHAVHHRRQALIGRQHLLLGPLQVVDGTGLLHVLVGKARMLAGQRVEHPGNLHELRLGQHGHFAESLRHGLLIGADFAGVGPDPLLRLRLGAHLADEPVGDVLSSNRDARARIPQSPAQAQLHAGAVGAVRPQSGIGTETPFAPRRRGADQVAQTREMAGPGDGRAIDAGDHGSHARRL